MADIVAVAVEYVTAELTSPGLEQGVDVTYVHQMVVVHDHVEDLSFVATKSPRNLQIQLKL